MGTLLGWLGSFQASPCIRRSQAATPPLCEVWTRREGDHDAMSSTAPDSADTCIAMEGGWLGVDHGLARSGGRGSHSGQHLVQHMVHMHCWQHEHLPRLPQRCPPGPHPGGEQVLHGTTSNRTEQSSVV